MTGQAAARPFTLNGALVRGRDHRDIRNGVKLTQTVLHAGERLEGWLQRLNAPVAGVVPLLQLAQRKAPRTDNLTLERGGGQLRCRGHPGGNVLTARQVNAPVFQPVKNQHNTLKPGDAPRDAVEVNFLPCGRDERRVALKTKNPDQLRTKDRAVFGVYRIHHTAVRVEADKKIPPPGKLVQCIRHTYDPLRGRRIPAVSPLSPYNTRNAQNCARGFGKI